MLMGYCCNGTYVHQAKGGIAGALNPYQLCLVRPDQLGNVDFNAGRKSNLNAVCCCDLGEVAMSAAVDIRDRDNMGALCERLKDGGGCGGAGRERKGVFGMFERSNGLLKVVP